LENTITGVFNYSLFLKTVVTVGISYPLG